LQSIASVIVSNELLEDFFAAYLLHSVSTLIAGKWCCLQRWFRTDCKSK